MIKTDEKLVNANIKLVDENKELKENIRRAINELENPTNIDYLKTRDLVVRILKGEWY